MTTNSERLARTQNQLGIQNKWGLWHGIETYGWNMNQFIADAASLHPFPPDVVYIKIGEDGTEWYNRQYGAIRAIYGKQGIGSVPYIFARPQYATNDATIAIRNGLLAGVVCLDMEEQWGGYGDASIELLKNIRAGLGSEPVLLVTGYADPLTAMPPWSFSFAGFTNVDCYLPQAYIGGWTIYHTQGVDAAMNWADGEIAKEFAHYGLGNDYPLAWIISPDGMTQQDLIAQQAYAKRWKIAPSVWYAGDVNESLRSHLYTESRAP